MDRTRLVLGAEMPKCILWWTDAEPLDLMSYSQGRVGWISVLGLGSAGDVGLVLYSSERISG